ncbi:hypothetical protein B9Q03_13165 [Candidatus Marsarchaeota G2 archaeon OSP_D]|jgi:Uncharacterized conserved protein containing a coiled-coil domain|uniref:Microtubule-binding protein n=1 Tax=Candidatus Marsarchaeota G2 archaeon OSP_D TaxID=1978157 RepID=A0A2R6ACV2_9ARCH|nr:MAG: hypothetical protein B9Q03_13165 [Candidatus Marsarchaeota G2 archaeon OSP_D]
MSVKEEFLRLLKEDEEFRLAAAGLLGYTEIIKRLDENERRMDAILAEIARLREDFNREIRLLHEDFNRLSEEQTKLRQDFNRLSEEQTKLRQDFNRLSEEQTKLRQDFNTEVSLLREDIRRLNDRFEVILGRMGRRWGADLERTLLGTFREVLEMEGIEPGRVERFSYLDRDGSVTGLKGRLVQVDILVRDGEVTVIEVKSFPERQDMDHLKDVVGYVEKIIQKRVSKVYLVAVNVDKDTLERAGELGFKVIYGSIVE